MSLTLDFQRSSSLDPREHAVNYGIELINVRFADDPVVHVDRIRAGIPRILIDQYVDAAMRHAFVQDLGADGWFAEIKGFEGVYGDGATHDAAVEELEAALPGWVELKLSAGSAVPDINGFSLPRPPAG